MNTVVDINSRSSYRCDITDRVAKLRVLEERIANLKCCLHMLIGLGIVVISVDMRRGKDKPQITVEPDALLHVIFDGDCANVRRQPAGDLTLCTWVACRYDCDIHWEDTCAS